VTVSDSSAEFNSLAFSVQDGGTLTLFSDSVMSNAVGLDMEGGTLYFANCLVANNTTAYQIFNDGTIAGTNPGTSLIAPGQGTTGTLSTAITLQ
jgi:sugar lactone lactonase YvrE